MGRNHADPARRVATRIRATSALALAAVVAGLTLSPSSPASPPAGADSAARVTHAQAIRAEVQARVQRLPHVPVAIVEATATDAIESFTLLADDLLERRFVAARDGVWYTLCPAGAVCPFPAPRLARPAADFAPRRIALELALRTLVETDASMVAVSLPTPRLAAFVVERDDLERETDLATLSHALRTPSMAAPPTWLRRSVDAITRPRTFVFLGFEATPTGGISWAGMPRWPTPPS